MLTQFRYAASNSLNCISHIGSSVSCLMSTRGPTTIMKVVALIVVDTFKCPAFLAFAHIMHKLCKIIPCGTNRYATTTVILEAFVPWIVAATFHFTPDLVNMRPVMPASISMCCPLHTSTRLGVSTSQAQIQDCDCFAAVAITNTRSESATTWTYFGRPIASHFKFSKSKSNDIDFSRHNVVLASLCLAAGFWHTPEACCDYKNISKRV